MARTLTAPVVTAVGNRVTLPGYLVRVDFAPPLYLSSRGPITWGGNDWAAWDIEVSGLSVDGASSAQTGSLRLGNTDYSIGALVLLQSVAGRGVSVWKYYGDAPNDPLLIFAGVADDSTIDPDGGAVAIGLQQAGGATLFCPRTVISRAAGFSQLPPRGTIINWNGEKFRLESAD
jgi:hypothetical protein